MSPVMKMTSWLLGGSLILSGQTPASGKCVLLSTSWVVRGFMEDWVLSDSGDRWSVNLDVGDLGGHLGAALDGRGGLLLARILVVMALPLDFSVKLRVLCTKFLPGALHGIDASVLSLGWLHRLRSACVSAVWSRKVPLAHTGAVLTLLDGVVGCDPGFMLFGFGCFAGTLVVFVSSIWSVLAVLVQSAGFLVVVW